MEVAEINPSSQLVSKHEQDQRAICKDLDEAIYSLGGFGRHQLKIYLIIQVLVSIGNFMVYPVSFYELEQSYVCR